MTLQQFTDKLQKFILRNQIDPTITTVEIHILGDLNEIEGFEFSEKHNLIILTPYETGDE